MVIIPDEMASSLIVGYKRGNGAMFRRHGNQWSDQILMTFEEYSVGTHLGGSSNDVIVLIRTNKVVDGILEGINHLGTGGRFTLGAPGLGSTGYTPPHPFSPIIVVWFLSRLYLREKRLLIRLLCQGVFAEMPVHICTMALIAVFALAAPAGFTQDRSSGINVVDEKVYARVPPTALSSLLVQLAEAAGIELSLVRDIALETELYANGTSLSRVVDQLLPESYGYVFEHDQEQNIIRLIVFTGDNSAGRSSPASARQRYLARQIGRQDNDTADIMHETLADRSLDDSAAKLIAIEQLSEMRSDHATQSLQAGMADSDPHIRLATAKALYRLQGEEAIPLIGQIYYTEDSASARKDLAAVVLHSPHPLAEVILRDSGLK